MFGAAHKSGLAGVLCALTMLLCLATPADALEKKGTTAAEAAAELADIFSQVGDQIYEECIFELSPEQVEVQHALIQAYVDQGATSSLARQLAVKQIQPPKLSDKCEAIRSQPAPEPLPWDTTLQVEKKPKLKAPPKIAKEPPLPDPPSIAVQRAAIADKRMLPRWDCGPNVDYVTITLNGFKRKLTGGEICNPYKDIVRDVPSETPPFRLGYVIATGRLFVVSDDARYNGRTIAWAISGRDVCRNNPDPDCLAARAIGSLPPGEYSFSGDKKNRVTWGPKTKRNVAGIWLRKLWNKERFTPQQRAAILARGNIAIHLRLKGEMSEACIGLEPKGWAYVAGLIKEGRATGVNAYLEEPYPQVAEAPPLVEGSSFSLTSLFK
ncbi:DUF2778 domain-containing protein [Hyphomicrobium sp. 1Nfss2.1]|uniref:DUF2778 domain-containing protein n=1 Tax=Hyphomicrobium sp. 1Nfss2.1 TaxID=3413936 RepID=UPI003C7AFF71